MMESANARTATLIGCIAIALWSTLAGLTVATGAIPPFELAALTFAIGGLLGLAYTAWRGRLVALSQPWPVWLLGVGGLFGYHALYFAALKLAPPAQAGLIAYLWPLLIVLLSAFLPGGGLAPRHILGAVLGFGGVVVLIYGRGDALSLPIQALRGFALALLCAFVWAIYSVLSRRFAGVPSEAIAGFCLVTAVLAAAAHQMFETSVWPAHLMPWLAILALGSGPVGLAFYVWDYGVKHGDIRFLGVASYAAPVLSTLILVAFGAAQANAALALACALIVGGAVLAAPRTAQNKTPAEAGV